MLPNTIRRIRAATQRNDHTGSLLLLAEALDEDSAADQLRKIAADQQREGHLTMTLYHERMAIYQKLMQTARTKLPARTSAAIYNAL